MKKLSVSDGELLIKAWKSVTHDGRGEPLDYLTRLYNTFLRFIASRRVRMIQEDVVIAEDRIALKSMSLEYMKALRLVIDPRGEQEEAELVLSMITATNDERREAIRNMRSNGVVL